jgi:hypothetical protein
LPWRGVFPSSLSSAPRRPNWGFTPILPGLLSWKKVFRAVPAALTAGFAVPWVQRTVFDWSRQRRSCGPWSVLWSRPAAGAPVVCHRSSQRSFPSRASMATLGVVVYSISGMTQLSRCLDSVTWAEKVSVFPLDFGDAGSATLGTMPARFEMDTDWVLHLWGDERVEAGLAGELQRICRNRLEAAPSLYYIPIRSHLLGRWVKGSLWSPAPSPRLCRMVRGFPGHWWDLKPKDHEKGASSVQGWISDYSCADLQTGMERINVLSSLWAERLRSEGRTPGQSSIAVYPIRILMRLLFVNGLLFQGMAGLSLAALAAYATLVSAMKCQESRIGKTY